MINQKQIMTASKKQFTLTLFLAISLIVVKPADAQHKNDFEAGLFNIGFGGVIGGIGAVINKKPNEKMGKVFLKGFSQGALGGYLLFESKRLVGKFSETGRYGYVWPSKLVNSAGVSIIENAAANRNFWEQWHINIGFNRLELHTKDKLSLKYRLMPFALYKSIEGMSKGKIDLIESLKIGSLVFNTNSINSSLLNNPFGVTLANSILIRKKGILSHELIHVYQYESFSGFNTYLNKPLKKLSTNIKWLQTYHKIFYTDFNYLFFHGLYSLYTDHRSNFFEKEAYYYTKR